MIKNKNILLILTMSIMLTLVACGNKDSTEEIIDTEDNIIESLVSENNTEVKPKGEKPKTENNKNDTNSSVENEFGDALDGYNIQGSTDDIKLNIPNKKIESSGKVVNTEQNKMDEINAQLNNDDTNVSIENLNINRFMYETNTEIINIQLNAVKYNKNKPSDGLLNNFIASIDILDTRNKYISNNMQEYVDVINTWNSYYSYINSIKKSMQSCNLEDKELDKLNTLTSQLSTILSINLINYDYVQDKLNSYNPELGEDNTIDENTQGIDNNIEVDEDNTINIDEDNSIIIEEDNSVVNDTDEDNTVSYE